MTGLYVNFLETLTGQFSAYKFKNVSTSNSAHRLVLTKFCEPKNYDKQWAFLCKFVVKMILNSLVLLLLLNY